ncbi:MAG: RNA polymerase sigma factor [Acidobacteria bacterium]|nr:RNA polymerase sigma factor [Acidobacteriota bacterium]
MTAIATTASEVPTLTHEAEDRLEATVRTHSRMVYQIAYSVLRDSADAEDAAQETFLRVLRYRKKFERVEDPKAWLARIAWRVAVEKRKRTLRASANTQDVANEIRSERAGAEQVLLGEERSAMLDQMIASLPEELRDPLVLSALEEISAREVAGMLGISEAAVRSRAFRARQILKDKLMGLISSRT